jgi:hypothetical protein
MLLRRHSLIESCNPKVLLEVISRVGTVVKAPKDTENGLPIPRIAGLCLLVSHENWYPNSPENGLPIPCLYWFFSLTCLFWAYRDPQTKPKFSQPRLQPSHSINLCLLQSGVLPPHSLWVVDSSAEEYLPVLQYFFLQVTCPKSNVLAVPLRLLFVASGNQPWLAGNSPTVHYFPIKIPFVSDFPISHVWLPKGVNQYSVHIPYPMNISLYHIISPHSTTIEVG